MIVALYTKDASQAYRISIPHQLTDGMQFQSEIGPFCNPFFFFLVFFFFFLKIHQKSPAL